MKLNQFDIYGFKMDHLDVLTNMIIEVKVLNDR